MAGGTKGLEPQRKVAVATAECIKALPEVQGISQSWWRPAWKRHCGIQTGHWMDVLAGGGYFSLTFPSLHFPGVFVSLFLPCSRRWGSGCTAESSWCFQQGQGGQPLLLKQKQPGEQRSYVMRPVPCDWCLLISPGLQTRLQKMCLTRLQRHSSLGRIWGSPETLLNLSECLVFWWLHLSVFSEGWHRVCCSSCIDLSIRAVSFLPNRISYNHTKKKNYCLCVEIYPLPSWMKTYCYFQWKTHICLSVEANLEEKRCIQTMFSCNWNRILV